MKKAFALFALTALGSISAFAGEWSGVISDSKCKHTDASEKSIACVQSCVKRGGEAVFIGSDEKVYHIDKASLDKVQPHLGHKVTVTGNIEGDTVKIESIKM
jgi:hypothetical protein